MPEPVAIDDLVFWEDNYNRGDVETIALSIRQFGFNNAPRIWRNNQIRGGNHSVKALMLIRNMGPQPHVDRSWPPEHITIQKDGTWVLSDWVDISHLDRREADAFAIADNELARKATQDNDLLLTYLKDIAAHSDTMLAAIGFDTSAIDELEKMVARHAHEALQDIDEGANSDSEGDQVDRGQQLQAIWDVKEGDIWSIPSRSGRGEHRLMCGSATDLDQVKSMCTRPVAGVFTSPPYAEQRKHTYGGIPVDEYVGWWSDVQAAAAAVLADDGSLFLNIKPHVEDGARSLYVFDLVLAMCRQWGWLLIDEHAWLRIGNPGSWPTRFKNEFEPVYHFSRTSKCKFRPQHVARSEGGAAKAAPSANNGRYYNTQDMEWSFTLPGNVRDIRDMPEALGHSAAFPAKLPDFFMRAYSDPGDVWYEPFCGSGTSIVAAEQTDRLCYGMELLPENCAITLQRLKDIGLEPKRIEP